MRERERYEEELLFWKRRMIELREKYEGTPAGFSDLEREKKEAISLWKQEEEKWKFKKERCILQYSGIPEQIFVGRERLLSRMKCALESGNGPVFLYGIGGMGKTAAAQAYAKEQSCLYDYILYLTCEKGLGQAVCDDGQLLIQGLFYSQERYGSRRRYLREKCRALSQIAEGRKILLILDNCNDFNEKDAELIFSLPCCILVTTRLGEKEWSGPWNGTGLFVGELEDERQWKAFFRAYHTKSFTEEEERRLWMAKERLGGHTLSVMLAAGKLNSGIAEEDGILSRSVLSGYPIGEGEKKVLCCLAAMPVRGIREELFYQMTGAARKTVERLVRFMLVKRQTFSDEGRTSLSMHPVVAQAVLEQWHPSAFDCRKLLEGVKWYLWDAWDRMYEENESMIPLAFSLLRTFQPDARLAAAFGKLIALLWIQGYFPEAEQYSLQLYETVEEYYGKDHIMSGKMALWTAAVYHNQTAFTEARKWYERGAAVLLSCKKESAQLLELQGEVLFKLARVNRYLGQTEKALTMILQAEKQAEKLLGKGQVKEQDTTAEVQLCYICLEKAKILFSMKQVEEAERIFTKAFFTIKRAYPDGYRINEFLYFKIKILMRKERFEEAGETAELAYRQASGYRREDDKELLKCRENQGDICVELGEYKKALGFYEEVLQKLQESYPFQGNWRRQLEEKVHKLHRKADGGRI